MAEAAVGRLQRGADAAAQSARIVVAPDRSAQVANELFEQAAAETRDHGNVNGRAADFLPVELHGPVLDRPLDPDPAFAGRQRAVLGRVRRELVQRQRKGESVPRRDIQRFAGDFQKNTAVKRFGGGFGPTTGM